MALANTAAFSLQDATLYIAGASDKLPNRLPLLTAKNVVFSDGRAKSPIYGSKESVLGHNRGKESHEGSFTLNAEDIYRLYTAVRANTSPNSPFRIGTSLNTTALLAIGWKLWWELIKRNPVSGLGVKSVVHTFYGVEFTSVPESWDEGSGNEITNLSFMYACRGFYDDGVPVAAAISDYDEIFTSAGGGTG